MEDGVITASGEASIPTCAVVLMAALLAGCQPSTSTEVPALARRAEMAPVGVVPLPHGFVRFCDQGRAIYAQNGIRESAIAVVPMAAECPQP